MCAARAPDLGSLLDVLQALDTGTLGFRAAVWATVRHIPRGTVAAYGDVAAILGRARAARQVGYALAALHPEDAEGPGAVPWWRVLRKDGSIPLQGDTTRGPRQAALLEADGVVVTEYRVDMARHRWQPGIHT